MKSAISWGISCITVEAVTVQPMALPQPRKAPPITNPSAKLCTWRSRTRGKRSSGGEGGLFGGEACFGWAELQNIKVSDNLLDLLKPERQITTLSHEDPKGEPNKQEHFNTPPPLSPGRRQSRSRQRGGGP